jgi:hypothetical protein
MGDVHELDNRASIPGIGTNLRTHTASCPVGVRLYPLVVKLKER